MNRGRPTVSKRQKELVRQQKKDKKAERVAQRKTEKESRPTPIAGEDPDIAGIVPGPQPPPSND